jgi:hypothetical protein
MKLVDNSDMQGNEFEMMPDEGALAAAALEAAAKSAAKAKERGDKAKAEALKNNEKKLKILKMQNESVG